MDGRSESRISSGNLQKPSRCLSTVFPLLVNRVHLLVRLDPELANGCSDQEVVRQRSPSMIGINHPWMAVTMQIPYRNRSLALPLGRRTWSLAAGYVVPQHRGCSQS